jgi:hypothetical protein
MTNEPDKPTSKVGREQMERAQNEAILPKNIKKNLPALKKLHKQNNEDKKLKKKYMFELSEEEIDKYIDENIELLDRLNDA